MPYVDKNGVRCDVRFPTDVYNRVETLATDHFKAPINRRSGKPQVTATIIQLVRWGLEYFEKGLYSEDLISDLDNNRSDKSSDLRSDKMLEVLLQKPSRLSSINLLP